MSPVVVLACSAVAGVVAYGIWCDPVRPWLEARAWRRDQRRALRELEEMQARRAYELLAWEAEVFALLAAEAPVDAEARWLEDWFRLPSAADPRRLA